VSHPYCPPDAYIFAQGHSHLVVQMVSQAARSIPQLRPDADGLLIVPMDRADEVFALFDEAGARFRLYC
jgi:hypothetical protein